MGDEHAAQLMQCMEVWGGNVPVDRAITMNGLDAWIYSKPFKNADGGGDVYYVSACATGRITRLLIADVAGHGASVKALAVTLRGLMKKYVNYLDQTEFVRAMNEQFTALSEGGRFATAIVTTFFSDSGHLSLCNAGHPPPLLYRARTGQWSYLRSGVGSASPTSDLPLGIIDQFRYTEFEISLDPKDLILCYTDALIEARFPDGELMGLSGLLEVANGITNIEPETFISQLMQAILARTGGAGLEGDDVTALLFRANRKSANWPTRLLGPWRVVSGMVRELGSGGKTFALPDLNVSNIGGALIKPLGKKWRGKVRSS